MSEALRYNEDKPMLSYFMRSFPRMAEAIARVKEMGAIKYQDGNWRLGNKPDDEYWDSLFRHLNHIFQGEDYDKDTGCLHIGHAVWNLCALLELNYPDLPARDDEIWADRAAHWAEQRRIRSEMPKPERMSHTVHLPPELWQCPQCGSGLGTSLGYECHECHECHWLHNAASGATCSPPLTREDTLDIDMGPYSIAKYKEKGREIVEAADQLMAEPPQEPTPTCSEKQCPKCGSFDTHIDVDDNIWECPECKHEWFEGGADGCCPHCQSDSVWYDEDEEEWACEYGHVWCRWEAI